MRLLIKNRQAQELRKGQKKQESEARPLLFHSEPDWIISYVLDTSIYLKVEAPFLKALKVMVAFANADQVVPFETS